VSAFSEAAALLQRGVTDHAFPAACAEVGRLGGPVWRQAFGALTYDPYDSAITDDTIFDLASLTKVLATATLAMRAVDDGALKLEDPVSAWLKEWRGADREGVTIRDLLAHASGLPAYLPFFRDHSGRAEFEPAICRTPLEYRPGTQSVYSDLGYILLGFVLEDARRDSTIAGRLDPASTLAAQFGRIASLVTSEPLTFNPPRVWRPRIAPTEFDAWRGRTLTGEVHDENAWALGGAAGHAGLFGTAAALGAFARAVLATLAGDRILARPETFRSFIVRTGVPGSSRALGWDTMLPTSSCGTRLSSTAIGHTGFTGTSLWIDWERDFYIVLLTNRVHPTRENDGIRGLRPAFHDAVVDALGHSRPQSHAEEHRRTETDPEER
jgi:CubicO group peptidase (beta-lactamase class C family)